MIPLRTLPQALEQAAAGVEGYVFIDGRTERRCTYAALHAAARRQARAIRARGLGRGDLVALIVADPEAFLIALFGSSIAGVTPASLSPPTATTELAQFLDRTAMILRTSGARAVITSTSLAEAIEGLRPRCPDLDLVLSIAEGPLRGAATDALRVEDRDRLDLAPPGVPPDLIARGEPAASQGSSGGLPGPAHPDVTLDDVAFVQFTSGSTSQPKGVAVSHRSLAANINAINGPSGLAASASDSAVSWLPLYHDMGLVGMALGALYWGRQVVLMTPSAFVKRPVEWLRAISRHRATVSFAPNFAYDLCVRRVKAHDLEGLDLSCWRVAGCGAEPIHAATLTAFADAFRRVGFRETSFLPSYGLAEHVLAATFAPRGRPLRVEHIGGQPVVSCGTALPDYRLAIVDERGLPLEEREIGEIVLAGPSVMQGYYGDDDLTSRTIRNGWLHTGDSGYLAGGELFVCGRTKDLIIVNGSKHHPQDLEWAVDELPGIRHGRVVAFATTSPGLADRVVVAVEPSGTVAAPVLASDIRRRISVACGLAVHAVVLVPSGTVARTTSGKLQRFAMKKRYEAGEFVPL